MTVKRRNTQIQQSILQLFADKPRALSHTEIENMLDVNADRATIFRVMNRFVEDGIAHKIVSDEGKSYFALCTGKCTNTHHHDNHSHFRCTKCNAMECMHDNVRISLPKGYTLLHSNIVVTGICNNCNA
jgi:Fur family ferric uptake transcriptional regulator